MSRSHAPLGDLYIVADGMGGYQGGATAAKIAVETIERVFTEATEGASPLTTIQSAIQQANAEIHKQAAAGKPEFEKMGSTAVVLLVRDGLAHVGHVGDSRAYIVRGGKLQQVTVDHTVVQGLVNEGIISEEEARDHDDASKLTRVLGPKAEVDVDLEPPIPLQYGDGILLCSDGLHGYVADADIQRAISQESRVQKTASRLVDLAMEAGGEDNITVQFVRYGDAETALVSPPSDPAESEGGRAWKLLASIAVAAVLGSAATFAYVTLHKPVPPGDPSSPAQASNPVVGITGVANPLEDLRTQIRDLAARVQKLEAAAKPTSGEKALGEKRKGATAGRPKRDPKPPVPKAGPGEGQPITPAPEGAPPGPEGGGNNPATPTDPAARPADPQPKTGEKKGDPETKKQ